MAWNLDGVSAFLRGRRKRAKYDRDHPVFEEATANPGEARWLARWECPECGYPIVAIDDGVLADGILRHRKKTHG